MEGKNKTVKRKTSSVKSKGVKKTNLTNDELLDQIINKKKTKGVSKPKVSRQSVEKRLKEIDKKLENKSLSSDEIYDLLGEKKKLSAELKKLPKTVSKSPPKKSSKTKSTKSTTAKKTTTKKTTTKKTTTKKTTTKKATTTKKTTTTKKPTTKKTTTKKTQVKKTTAKKPTTKKTQVKKTTAQKPKVQKPKVQKPKVQKPPVEVPKEEPKVEVPKEVVPEVPKEPIVLKPDLGQEKKDLVIRVIIIALLTGFIVGVLLFITLSRENFNPARVILSPVENNIEEIELQNQYEECLNRENSDSDRTEELIKAENDLNSYLKKYRVSVGYRDVKTGYTYRYNESPVYYAASSAKALSAYYLYKKASEGEINLDATLKYTSRFKYGASKEMAKIKLNSNVKIRDLVKYSITVSDNSAYQMLISYIGKAKLRNFAKDLGIRYLLTGGDNMGNIIVDDGLILWNEIYDFLEEDNEYSKELRGYFVSAEQNDLAMPNLNIEAAHKYGEYSPFYHDLGIVYTSNPYIAVVLTREFGKSMEAKIQNINSELYKLHTAYYVNREKVCKLEVYGE